MSHYQVKRKTTRSSEHTLFYLALFRKNSSPFSETPAGHQPAPASPLHAHAPGHAHGPGRGVETFAMMPPPRPVHDLLIHPSDRLVKPIVGNAAIERVAVVSGLSGSGSGSGSRGEGGGGGDGHGHGDGDGDGALPFPQHSARALVQMEQSQLEEFLTKVQR